MKFIQIRPYIGKCIESIPENDEKFKDIFWATNWSSVKGVFKEYDDKKAKEIYNNLFRIDNKKAFNAFYTSILWWDANKIPSTYDELLRSEYWDIAI